MKQSARYAPPQDDSDPGGMEAEWWKALVSRFTPRSASEWGAALPSWLGMLGLIACFVVWAATPDHIVEPLFVTAFGGLLAVGAGAKALDTLKQQPPAPPIPPGDPPTDTADAERQP